jgi:hypothetical protein
VGEPCRRGADESEDCDEVLHLEVGGVDVDRREGGMTVDHETAERKTTCFIWANRSRQCVCESHVGELQLTMQPPASLHLTLSL